MIQVRPSAFVGAQYKAVTVLQQLHIFKKVNPGGLSFFIHLGAGAAGRVGSVQLQMILTAVQPLKIERPAVVTPQGMGDIVIRVGIQIQPGDAAIGQIRHAQGDFGIGIAGFGIAGGLPGTVHTVGAEQAEHRHRGIVVADERKSVSGRRPPESPAGAVVHLFIIHPRMDAVQNQLSAIMGDAHLLAAVDGHHIHIMLAGESHPSIIR